ncbi:MAG: ATP-binding protein [Planctomycetaceae bacterium]
MKDTFVATLSHELRTPLNAILGWTQILQQQKSSSTALSEGLTVIERNARSQAQMIEDLLDMSRIIAGKLRLDLQDTDLPSIVESAITTVALAAEAKGVRVEKLIDPMSGVKTTGDPHRLQQVVWNLLSNAVKFTPRDGKVQVILQRVRSHVELTVSDTGEGISPEFLPFVFERFRQSDSTSSRHHGGLGLGLSIVRSLVEMHGGTVRAASRGRGEGAMFVVSLPVRVVADYDDETRQLENCIPSDRNGRVDLAGVRALSIDDQEDARELMHRILSDFGCKVSSAGSAEQAEAVLRQHDIDVIISDIGMPGTDGYAFIRSWRKAESMLGRPKIPAIALTAYARAEDRRRAILAGFQAHVTKPVDVEELLALVGSVTNRL